MKLYELKRTLFRPFRWVDLQFYRFKRLIRWIPRVYMTPDFDFGYALMFFQWKLREVRKVIDTNRHHVGDEHRVRRMWELDKILDRIIAEDYETQIYKDDEHGDLEFGEPDENGLCDLNITMPPLKECVMIKDSLKQYQHAEMLFKQDVDLMCTYLKKYSRGWWD